jgi:hypothetical protein
MAQGVGPELKIPVSQKKVYIAIKFSDSYCTWDIQFKIIFVVDIAVHDYNSSSWDAEVGQ